MTDIYRQMLSAYPAGFREAFSREMAVAFHSHARDVVQDGGSRALLPFATRILWDWLKALLKERSEMHDDRTIHVVAAVQLALILPAALFIGALVLRHVPMFQAPAQGVVMLYAGKLWTLWLLLLVLPLGVLFAGCATLAGAWSRTCGWGNASEPAVPVLGHASTLVVAAITVFAAGILTTVILHMLAH